MSADNGYVIRQRASDDKFVLQHYFDSSDSYPDINSEKALEFDTLEAAVTKYHEIDSEWPYSEYGLSLAIREKV